MAPKVKTSQDKALIGDSLAKSYMTGSGSTLSYNNNNQVNTLSKSGRSQCSLGPKSELR